MVKTGIETTSGSKISEQFNWICKKFNTLAANCHFELGKYYEEREQTKLAVGEYEKSILRDEGFPESQ